MKKKEIHMNIQLNKIERVSHTHTHTQTQACICNDISNGKAFYLI